MSESLKKKKKKICDLPSDQIPWVIRIFGESHGAQIISAAALQFDGATQMWVSVTRNDYVYSFTICEPVSQKSSVHNVTNRASIMISVPGLRIKKLALRRDIQMSCDWTVSKGAEFSYIWLDF